MPQQAAELGFKVLELLLFLYLFIYLFLFRDRDLGNPGQL